MATTPTVNKLQLGSLLRHFRQEARLTQEQVGAAVYPKVSSRIQQVRIAKIETGERQLHQADLTAMLALYKVTDPELLALIDQLHTNTTKRGRWGGYRAVYDEAFRKYVDLEMDARWVRECALEIVPDLLQAEVYVRALFGIQYEEGLLPGGDFPAAVQARMVRQNALSPHREDGSPPMTLHFVMSESCVRRIVGNRAIMREQMEHLVRLSQQPNVTIQLIPFSAPVQGLVFERYCMLRVPVPGLASDLDFIYLRSGNDPRYLDDKPSVQSYEHNFQAISMSALRPDDTREFLREIKREFRTQ